MTRASLLFALFLTIACEPPPAASPASTGPSQEQRQRDAELLVLRKRMTKLQERLEEKEVADAPLPPLPAPAATTASARTVTPAASSARPATTTDRINAVFAAYDALPKKTGEALADLIRETTAIARRDGQAESLSVALDSAFRLRAAVFWFAYPLVVGDDNAVIVPSRNDDCERRAAAALATPLVKKQILSFGFRRLYCAKFKASSVTGSSVLMSERIFPVD